MKVQKFDLNLVPGGVPVYVHCDQYDEGRVFQATIYDGDELYVFDGTETIEIRGTKADGHGFDCDATDASVTTSGSTLTFSVTDAMTDVAGACLTSVILSKSGIRIGTCNFILFVQRASLQAETVIGSDSFGGIIEDAVADYLNEHGIVIDDTLSVSGAAADAKATGDELSDLRSAIEQIGAGGSVPTTVREAIYTLFANATYIAADLSDEIAIVESWAGDITSITLNTRSITFSEGSGTYRLVATTVPSGGYVVWRTSDPLVAKVSKGGVVTAVGNGTATITATSGDYSAYCNVSVSGFATLTGIEATYTPSETITDAMDLTDLIPDLVVMASYDNGTTRSVTDYTLSGTLTEGTSTITVSYGGFTDTFTVTVVHELDYTADALDGVSWINGKEYNVNTGELSDAANYNITEKFRVQGQCFYNIMPNNSGGYNTLYIWDENDNYIGALRNNSAALPIMTLDPNRLYVLGTTASASSLAGLTMLPVDNRETATSTSIEIDLAANVNSITWAGGTTAELNITSILSAQGITQSDYTTKINTINDKVLVIGGNIQQSSSSASMYGTSANHVVFSIGTYQTNINLQMRSPALTSLQAAKDWITTNSVKVIINQ